MAEIKVKIKVFLTKVCLTVQQSLEVHISAYEIKENQRIRYEINEAQRKLFETKMEKNYTYCTEETKPRIPLQVSPC